MSLNSAVPLDWPSGVKRSRGRVVSSFGKRTYAAAEQCLLDELRRMRATGVVVSSNVRTRSGRGDLDDPGVAVRFMRRNEQHVMACDRYRNASCNAYALAKTIESLRAIERHGSASLGNQAFSAFRALPPSSDAGAVAPPRPWREILSVPAELGGADALDLAELRYRRAIKAHHDKPGDAGDQELVAQLNGAIHRARQELR